MQNERSLLLKNSDVLEHILEAGSGESLKTVLRTYSLTPKDKVILAHAIALSYWKYYDTAFMRKRWTSDTLWFMPEEGRQGTRKAQLALSAYLPLPFGSTTNVNSNTEVASDLWLEDMLSHRCPRIFDIGILLLEIGRARPFQRGYRRDPVAQANLDHKIATDDLRELQDTAWDGYGEQEELRLGSAVLSRRCKLFKRDVSVKIYGDESDAEEEHGV